MNFKSNVYWLAIGTISILGLTRIYGFLYGTSYYWSFRSIATHQLEDSNLIGMVITLLIPVLVGVMIASLSSVPVSRTAAGAGFLAALLQSWPVLFFTNVRSDLVPNALLSQPLKLFSLHLLYVLSYTFLAWVSAWVVDALRGRRDRYAVDGRADTVVRTVLIGLLVCLIWQVLSSLWR